MHQHWSAQAIRLQELSRCGQQSQQVALRLGHLEFASLQIEHLMSLNQKMNEASHSSAFLLLVYQLQQLLLDCVIANRKYGIILCMAMDSCVYTLYLHEIWDGAVLELVNIFKASMQIKSTICSVSDRR